MPFPSVFIVPLASSDQAVPTAVGVVDGSPAASFLNPVPGSIVVELLPLGAAHQLRCGPSDAEELAVGLVHSRPFRKTQIAVGLEDTPSLPRRDHVGIGIHLQSDLWVHCAGSV